VSPAAGRGRREGTRGAQAGTPQPTQVLAANGRTYPIAEYIGELRALAAAIQAGGVPAIQRVAPGVDSGSVLWSALSGASELIERLEAERVRIPDRLADLTPAHVSALITELDRLRGEVVQLSADNRALAAVAARPVSSRTILKRGADGELTESETKFD
jgi:hypothetical protein